MTNVYRSEIHLVIDFLVQIRMKNKILGVGFAAETRGYSKVLTKKVDVDSF